MVRAAWNLHEYTVETFLDNSGVLASFDTKEKRCLLMKVAASRSVGFDTLSLSHVRRDNVTNVVYYSLGDESNVFDNLLADPERCLQPTFFAAVLYRCHQQRVEHFRQAVDNAIITIEESSKFGGPGRLFGRRFGSDDMRLEGHGSGLTTRLSYVQTELAIAGHLARASLKCGEWVAKIAEKDVSNWKMSEGTRHGRQASTQEELETDIRAKTSDEVEYMRRRAETVVSQLQGIQDRVQSQITFVSLRNLGASFLLT